MTDTPRDLGRILDKLDSASVRVRSEYRWVHSSAYGRTVGEQAKVHTSGASDPTGSLASNGEKLRQRKALDVAARYVNEAHSAIRAAEHILERAGAHEPERIAFEPLRYPRTATYTELAESAQAKSRREVRGEGWGEG